MKVWITKYALSKGIFEVEVEEPDPRYPHMVVHCTGTHGAWRNYYHGEGRDWHRSKEAAVQRARKMATAKIKAVETSLKKLRALCDNPKFAAKAIGT